MFGTVSDRQTGFGVEFSWKWQLGTETGPPKTTCNF